jgi:hypothetical protein
MRSAGDPELLDHHTVFVYPLRHQLVGGARRSRLASLEPRWAPWASRFTDADLAARLEATGFFFPFVRDLLYPEVPWLRHQAPDEDCEEWAEILRSLSAEGLSVIGRELDDGVMRLTLRPEIHAALEHFLIRCPEGHTAEAIDLPARCDWVDAELYPSGLGFLLFRVRLTAERPALSQLIRLNQSLRQVLPPNRRSRLAELEIGRGKRLSVRDLMNFLTQGLAAPWDLPEEDRGEFPAPGKARPYAESESGRTYGERCHLLSFAVCDLAGCDPQELPSGPFPSAADRIVFEMAAGITLGESVRNPAWVPSAEQAMKYCRDNRLSLWRIWTGMVFKDALVFLGSEDVPYNRRSLPRQVENDYLPLYLFVLYQKLQLFTFSNELLREVALSSGRLAGARALLERFVAFRSRYCFAEVTRKPQGGELYRTFQRGLEVPAAYEMVTGSVKDVKDYYEGVWARRVQWLKDGLTYGGPAVAALWAAKMALEMALGGWALLLAGALGAAVGLLTLLRWRRAAGARRRRPKSARAGGAVTLRGPWPMQAASKRRAA